jgi:hypothetical protein
MKKIQSLVVVLFLVIAIVIIGSCSKSDTAPTPTTPTVDPCATSTLTISPTSTPSNVCTANGSITVSTTGSTAGTTFQYQLDDKPLGTVNSFTNVAVGDHTITVKNNLGCVKTAKITVATLSSGNQFLAVKDLLSNKCTPCHTTRSDGTFNILNQCNIIAKSSKIVDRAVTIGDMPKGGPALTATEKKIITDWITGGGKDTN